VIAAVFVHGGAPVQVMSHEHAAPDCELEAATEGAAG